jgi:hypothetical protein
MHNLHQAAKAAEKESIGFEIIEKQTLRRYEKSLGIFEGLLIFFYGSLIFCLRYYYKLKIILFIFKGKYEGEILCFLKNGERTI